MQQMYTRIIDYIVSSGKRIKSKSGNIEDIGIAKQYLTEEDLAIERGFKEIIKSFGPDHSLFAEEEHDMFQQTDHVWAVDPISGTATFIKGAPHYAVVISHLYKKDPQFAAVYDPSVDELFTAYKGKGAFLNNERITVTSKSDSEAYIAVKIAPPWRHSEQAKLLWNRLFENYKVRATMHSTGIDYCYVACGRFDGIVTLTKDAFPEFAASLFLKEAGGKFTNGRGQEQISPDDRVFIGGNAKTYPTLQHLVNEINL